MLPIDLLLLLLLLLLMLLMYLWSLAPIPLLLLLLLILDGPWTCWDGCSSTTMCCLLPCSNSWWYHCAETLPAKR
ncbi:hypothetical protein DFJ73DRAFT_855089 [Zopfochytrium polystomum]|nr:hypothetical protein DFJ73DRAFT_855089 [Zopfochytrium polystomum]